MPICKKPQANRRGKSDDAVLFNSNQFNDRSINQEPSQPNTGRRQNINQGSYRQNYYQDSSNVNFNQGSSRPNINQGNSRPNINNGIGAGQQFRNGNGRINNQGCQLIQPKECANNRTICDDVSDYPEDLVRQSLQKVSAKIKDLYLKVTYYKTRNDNLNPI